MQTVATMRSGIDTPDRELISAGIEHIRTCSLSARPELSASDIRVNLEDLEEILSRADVDPRYLSIGSERWEVYTSSAVRQLTKREVPG